MAEILLVPLKRVRLLKSTLSKLFINTCFVKIYNWHYRQQRLLEYWDNRFLIILRFLTLTRLIMNHKGEVKQDTRSLEANLLLEHIYCLDASLVVPIKRHIKDEIYIIKRSWCFPVILFALCLFIIVKWKSSAGNSWRKLHMTLCKRDVRTLESV